MPSMNILAEVDLTTVGGQVSTIFAEALNTIQTDVQSFVTIALPVGLSIAGLFMAIRLGIGFFRSVAH